MKASLPKENVRMPLVSDFAWVWISAVLICVFLLCAYANSFNVPFVFDDLEGIVRNPSIRQLDSWAVLWSPDNATGAVGRPLVNLSLAINYALGGLDVTGYHVANLLFHALASLALFGVARRTALLPNSGLKPGIALSFGLSVALLWAVHPLQTESVTCVIQRTELLGGLFYLLTLYAFVRGAADGASRGWLGLSVAACLFGMGAKEIVATAPVVVFVFDRTFVAGTFGNAWKKRRMYYLALVGTWLPLMALVLIAKNRGGLVGFGLGMSSLDYALTQCEALLIYLKLVFWPDPLVVDYGADVVAGLGAVGWQAFALVALLSATCLSLVRWPKIGFLGFAFFVIIAPSSSIIPLTTQTISEHRMYLSLAAVVAVVAGWIFARLKYHGLAVTLPLAVVLGIITHQRNNDYRTPLGLWAVTVKDKPDNARARLNHGNYLAEGGRIQEAIGEFQMALKLRANYPDAAFNLGNALSALGRFEEAEGAFRQATALDPKHAMAHYGLANAWVRTGRLNEALAGYERAAGLRPGDADIFHAWASASAFAGQREAALEIYQRALALTPQDPSLHGEYGSVLAQLRRWDDSIAALRNAVRMAPMDPRWRFALSMILLDHGPVNEAIDSFTVLVQAHPRMPEASNGLGLALMKAGRVGEAVDRFKTAVQLNPGWSEARENLERAEITRDLRTPARQ